MTNEELLDRYAALKAQYEAAQTALDTAQGDVDTAQGALAAAVEAKQAIDSDRESLYNRLDAARRELLAMEGSV